MMAPLRDFTLRLPAQTIEELTARAEADDVTPGHLVRTLLHREFARAPAKRPNRADERLVARLQRLLAPTMASAASWSDMEWRLAQRGYALHPAGGGLALHDAQGNRLCKSSELGFAYSRLVRRFGAPMPGHPHRMQHLLTKKAAGADPDDLTDLIEPF